MAGDPKELLKAKYERNGWPAQARPDIKPIGAKTLFDLSSVSLKSAALSRTVRLMALLVLNWS